MNTSRLHGPPRQAATQHSAPDLRHSALDLQRDDLLAPLRGPGEAIGRLWSQARVIAPHFRTLLLTGERGCGPEAVVHLLQILSPFHAGPLVALDAAADPEGVARRLRSPKRLLQSVAGGVLYVHEVDRCSPETQGNLLRFLRSNRHHLCALVAFSARDLGALTAAGDFSRALAEGLGSLPIPVPSLRDRREDLPLLAELCLREAWTGPLNASPTLTPGFLAALVEAEWPGNLDQLRSVMNSLAREAAAVDQARAFSAEDLHLALTELSRSGREDESAGSVRLVKLDQVVQEHIRSVLIACQGNKLRASEVLGISRSTLYRMLDSTSPGSLALIA